MRYVVIITVKKTIEYATSLVSAGRYLSFSFLGSLRNFHTPIETSNVGIENIRKGTDQAMSLPQVIAAKSIM